MFERSGAAVKGRYASDGYEVLTYERSNRGVRYVFRKVDGDDTAPDVTQFSDHRIGAGRLRPSLLGRRPRRPARGADELAHQLAHLLPVYPSSLDAEGIVREMLAH